MKTITIPFHYQLYQNYNIIKGTLKGAVVVPYIIIKGTFTEKEEKGVELRETIVD